jgi:hypothetical protein
VPPCVRGRSCYPELQSRCRRMCRNPGIELGKCPLPLRACMVLQCITHTRPTKRPRTLAILSEWALSGRRLGGVHSILRLPDNLKSGHDKPASELDDKARSERGGTAVEHALTM